MLFVVFFCVVGVIFLIFELMLLLGLFELLVLLFVLKFGFVLLELMGVDELLKLLFDVGLKVFEFDVLKLLFWVGKLKFLGFVGMNLFFICGLKFILLLLYWLLLYWDVLLKLVFNDEILLELELLIDLLLILVIFLDLFCIIKIVMIILILVISRMVSILFIILIINFRLFLDLLGVGLCGVLWMFIWDCFGWVVWIGWFGCFILGWGCVDCGFVWRFSGLLIGVFKVLRLFNLKILLDCSFWLVVDMGFWRLIIVLLVDGFGLFVVGLFVVGWFVVGWVWWFFWVVFDFVFVWIVGDGLFWWVFCGLVVDELVGDVEWVGVVDCFFGGEGLEVFLWLVDFCFCGIWMIFL